MAIRYPALSQPRHEDHRGANTIELVFNSGLRARKSRRQDLRARRPLLNTLLSLS